MSALTVVLDLTNDSFHQITISFDTKGREKELEKNGGAYSEIETDENDNPTGKTTTYIDPNSKHQLELMNDKPDYKYDDGTRTKVRDPSKKLIGMNHYYVYEYDKNGKPVKIKQIPSPAITSLFHELAHPYFEGTSINQHRINMYENTIRRILSIYQRAVSDSSHDEYDEQKNNN